MDISKEWCLRMAQIEGVTEIGAGRLAVDPYWDPVAERWSEVFETIHVPLDFGCSRMIPDQFSTPLSQ